VKATTRDRVYAVLHQLESEQARRHAPHEADDWLDGVKTGSQAEKRLLILRLHWILDPHSEAVDLKDAGPLVARLNERHVKGYDDGYDGEDRLHGPEYPDGPSNAGGMPT